MTGVGDGDGEGEGDGKGEALGEGDGCWVASCADEKLQGSRKKRASSKQQAASSRRSPRTVLFKRRKAERDSYLFFLGFFRVILGFRLGWGELVVGCFCSNQKTNHEATRTNTKRKVVAISLGAYYHNPFPRPPSPRPGLIFSASPHHRVFPASPPQ